MQRQMGVVIAAGLLLTLAGFAKDKSKGILPPYVLQARTVAVIIDPDAGLSVEDPRANQVAQKDVETALANWGRFETVLGTQAADLIVVVRRGHGRMVDRTIADPRQNNRPGVINPTDNGIAIGGQHGRQPGLSDGTSPGMNPEGNPGIPEDSPHAQTEIGGTQDAFLVYQGGVEKPLEASPAWRYMAKDGLSPHSVPAVTEFRKAIAQAEKAAAKHP